MVLSGIKGKSLPLPALDAAVEKVANVGVDFEPASNDFDDLPIWGEIEEAVRRLWQCIYADS